MERPLICSSVRKRPEWAGLTKALLQSKTACGSWKETQLNSHDMAVPVSTPATAETRRAFCGILMTPNDVGTTEGASRIERLYHFGAGKDVGIIFLLKSSNSDQQNAVTALMTLQLEVVKSWPLPIIPVESAAAVPACLAKLRQQLVTAAASRAAPGLAIGLLPFCTADRRPLVEHTVNILTDTTSGFRDLVEKLSSDDGTDSEICQFLGQEVENLKMFWKDEYLVD
ncbi:hypothetical protein F5Y17DRAFT_468545 [Xylariaceae sp. FL0594]|nr:hypothetical protein F5Y17DRAFT_468545 [Xylariaceae sp. FL0594]